MKFQWGVFFSGKQMGPESVNTIIINELVPFYFFSAQRLGEGDAAEEAIRILSGLDYEMNTLTRNWIRLGIRPDSAAVSQSLIELKNTYCDRKKCLECSIGHMLLREQRPVGVEPDVLEKC